MAVRSRVAEVHALPDGSEVELRGWVFSLATLGKLHFVRLRDSTGVAQVVVKPGSSARESIESTETLRREDSLVVTGTVRHDPRAPEGVEVQATSIVLVGRSLDDFPIQKGVSPKVVGDYRHLYIRSRRLTRILQARSELLQAMRGWFEREGFVEFSCPTMITAAVEGGATLFEINYFNKKAYLTQSSQFYLEAGIFSSEKVYTIQPSFRAERSKTPRHLTEYWMLEAEAAWCDMNKMIDMEENLISEVTTELSRPGHIFKSINPQFKPLEKPFKRMKYDEALGLLDKAGVKFEWGSDLGSDEEKVISKEVGEPVFITHYPKVARAFYHKPDPSRPDVVLSEDLLVEKMGEIIGGGERIDDYGTLLARIQEAGMDPADYSWYLDLRRYGSVPHAGYGLGIERFLAYLLDLPNIRLAIPFPRTLTRIFP